MPQNIDMQDRVVGPLTMVQFLYAVFGGGFAYITYSTIPQPFSWLLVAIIVSLTVCLIFVKINERPFLNFLGNLVMFMFRPKLRVWSKSTEPFKVDVYQNPNNKQQKVIQPKHTSKEDLHRLAETIDQHDPNHNLIKV